MERLAFRRKRQGREGQRWPRNGSSMKKTTGGGNSMECDFTWVRLHSRHAPTWASVECLMKWECGGTFLRSAVKVRAPAFVSCREVTEENVPTLGKYMLCING